jgi:hypothetical protein
MAPVDRPSHAETWKLVESGRDRDRFILPPVSGQESTAWNRRVNRDRLLIQWNFSRQDAQRVFHYQSNLFSRSQN